MKQNDFINKDRFLYNRQKIYNSILNDENGDFTLYEKAIAAAKRTDVINERVRNMKEFLYDDEEPF